MLALPYRAVGQGIGEGAAALQTKYESPETQQLLFGKDAAQPPIAAPNTAIQKPAVQNQNTQNTQNTQNVQNNSVNPVNSVSPDSDLKGYQPVVGLNNVFKKGNSYTDLNGIQQGTVGTKGLSVLPSLTAPVMATPEEPQGLQRFVNFNAGKGFEPQQIQNLIDVAQNQNGYSSEGSADNYRRWHSANKTLDQLLGFNQSKDRLALEGAQMAAGQNETDAALKQRDKQMGLENSLAGFRAALEGQDMQQARANQLYGMQNQRLATVAKGLNKQEQLPKLVDIGTDPNTGSKAFAKQTKDGLETVSVKAPRQDEINSRLQVLYAAFQDPTYPEDKKKAMVIPEIQALKNELATYAQG